MVESCRFKLLVSYDGASALATTLETFSALGVPAEPEKCEGPSTTLPTLGIEVDTVKMQLRLPEDKLHCLNQSIREWRGRKRQSFVN